MAQETRKDPRAKVLTVTVRYKSATLDEFIEHHSHDVSRGGMFIKTVSPFPPGTLLKIEVRIAGDQRVMQGVGRVVWKRESGEAQDGAPAGMGVKFIKIDDASRSVIDQLVSKSGGAVSAFDKGAAEQPAAAAAAGAAAAAAAAAPTPAPVPVAASDSPKLGAMRKATMIGLGAFGSDAADSDAAKPEAKAAAFFPESLGTPSEPPPEDRTVMKQAAELLQDALREAGGSLDEIGTPTVGASGTPAASSHPPAPVREPPRPGKSESPPLVEEKPATKAAEAKKPVEKAASPSSSKPTSSRPAGTRAEARASSRPARRASIPAETIPGESSGSGKITAIVLGIAIVGGGLYLLTRTPPEPPASEEQPAATPEPTPTPAEEQPAAAPPSEPLPPPVEPSALPADSAAPSAVEPPPSAAEPAPPAATTVKKPKPVAAPKPAPVPTAATPTEPVMTATPKPVEPAPVAPPTPPAATTAPAPTPKPTATAAPKPKAPSSSDNPF
jgi:uncharacterized protein (TIGR02266 family)